MTYGHLCEVSSKDTRDVVGSENFVFPVEIFAILSFLGAWCLGQRDDNIIAGRRELTLGGDSNLAWRSLIRLLLPFIRNVPSISVARLWNSQDVRHVVDETTGKMEIAGVWVCAGVMRAKRTLFFQVESPGIT